MINTSSYLSFEINKNEFVNKMNFGDSNDRITNEIDRKIGCQIIFQKQHSQMLKVALTLKDRTTNNKGPIKLQTKCQRFTK